MQDTYRSGPIHTARRIEDSHEVEMVKVPGTEPSRHAVVWHHTTAEGLIGILQTRELWASSSLTLNDASELRYGFTVLKEVWRDLRCSLGPEAVPMCVNAMDHLLGNDEELLDAWDVNRTGFFGGS